MGVTLKEVAELAGVSRSAVSRTFTKGASVSALTRRKVEDAADQLGYQPNALASSLTTGRTKLIGLIANNFHNPIFLEIFDLYTRGLQELGLRPLLVNLTDETDPNNSLQLLGQYSVDGVIVASSTLSPDFPRAFREAGIPVVHSFGRAALHPKVNVVGVDNAECGRIAATSLIARGYRHVGFLGGPQTATSTQDRLRGFRHVIESRSDIQLSVSFAKGYTFEAGRAAMTRALQDQPAQAYFCGDDVLSIGALSAVQSLGLRVPEDVGVIGFNDMEMAKWENINLTTIQQPIKPIIQTSIEVVMSLLEAENQPPVARLFPCRLVERGTLKPAV